MRRQRLPPSDGYYAVEVIAADAPKTSDDVVAIGPTRRYPRLARLAARVPRRLAIGVGAVALGVLVTVQVTHRETVAPVPAALPPSPLLAAACASGTCMAQFAEAGDVADVRDVLDPSYTVTGLLTRDPHGVLRQIQMVAADGIHVLTLRAAQADRVPRSWSAPLARTQRADFEWTVIRNVLTNHATHTRWLVEVRTAGPVDSVQLLGAALALSMDDGLVD